MVAFVILAPVPGPAVLVLFGRRAAKLLAMRGWGLAAEAGARLLTLLRRHLLPSMVIFEHVLALPRRQLLKALEALA